MPASEISFELKNNLSELELLWNNFSWFGESQEISEKILFEINLALEEVFTNIVSYAYADNTEHQIRVKISHESGALIIRIEDDGIEFNPIESDKPDIVCSLEKRKIGGLGIHLAKQMMNNR